LDAARITYGDLPKSGKVPDRNHRASGEEGC
jgi:hypothetical protein